MMSKDTPRPGDKWIPFYFVLFFLTFIVADAIMVMIALDTNSGVVTEHAYEKGLAYNKTLEAAQKQQSLNWQGKIEFENGILSYALADAQGNPIKGAQVQAKIERPVTAGMDRILVMTEVKPGRYEAGVTLAKPGLWNARVFVKWQQHTYQQATSLTIRP